MTIGDFFDFNKAEYARRISFYDVNRLRKQEVVKIRQHTAAMCSITTGAAGALLSGGGTLLLSAYGARRLSVAHSKLELIQAELTKRGIALHELQKRDIFIPVGASIVGMGVGVGIDEAAAVATNTIPMEASLPPGSSLTDALIRKPNIEPVGNVDYGSPDWGCFQDQAAGISGHPDNKKDWPRN
ncbi:hypothetical protein ACKRZS_008751 [Fusarium odoratissimum]